MSDPEKRRYVRRSVDAATGREEYEVVELTPQEANRLNLTDDARYLPETPETMRAAAASERAAEARRAAEQTSAFTTGGFNLVDGLGAGAASQALRRSVGDAQAERIIGTMQTGNPGTALVSRMVGNVLGLPGLGAVGAGRTVAGLAGMGRVAAGVGEGIFGGVAAAAEQAALTGEDISEHLMSNVGIGILAGAGGEMLFGARNLGRTGATEVAAREAAIAQATASATEPGFLRRFLGGLQEVGSGVNPNRSVWSNRPLREVMEEALPVEQVGETAFLRDMAGDIDELLRVSDSLADDLSLARFTQNPAVRDAVGSMADGAVHSAVRRRLGVVGGNIQRAIDLSDAAATPAARRAIDALGEAVPEGNLEAMARAAQIRTELDAAARGASGRVRAALQDGITELDEVIRGAVGGDAGTLLSRRADAALQLRSERERLRRILSPDGSRVSKEKLRARLNAASASGEDSFFEAIEQFSTVARGADDAVGAAGGVSSGRSFLSDGSAFLRRARQYRSFREAKATVAFETQQSGLAAAFGNFGGFGIGAGLGFLGGGPIGAAAGGFLGAMLTRPVRTQMAMFKARNLILRNRTRAQAAIRQTETNLSSTKRVPHVSLPAPKAGIALALYNGSREERRAQYDEIVANLEELAANPTLMAENIANNLGGLDGALPGASMHVAMQAQNAASVLLGNLPPSRRRGIFQMRLGSTDIPASQAEVDDFLQVAAVVEDPFFGVDLMNAGRISPASADALRRVYPRIHGEIVAAVSTTIQQRRRRGEHVNYQAAVQYSLFAGAPLDETLEPSFIAAMQNQSAQTAQQEQAQFGRPVSTRRPTGFTDNALSSTQQLEQR